MSAGFVCYVHRRADTGEPFYVGIGTPERPTRFRDRSRYWKRVAAKAGVEVAVVASGVSWGEACAWERAAIELVGRRDRDAGPLVNLTDGGDGTAGRRHGATTRAKMSAKAKAKAESPEGRARLLEMSRARVADPEWRRRAAEGNRRLAQDPEWQRRHARAAKDPERRNRIAAALAARWADPEFRRVRTAVSVASLSKPVRCVDTGEAFASGRAAVETLRARGLRATASGVSDACTGRQATHAGYRWEFVTGKNNEANQ